MKLSPILFVFLLLTGICLLPACSQAEAPEAGLAAPLPTKTATLEPVLSALEVTEAFYDWYLHYPLDANGELVRSALGDRAYRESPHLTAGFIQLIDAQLEVEHGDPFLLAQALPQGFTVEAVSETGNIARTLVRLQFGEMTHDRLVDLVREADGWKIDAVEAGGSARQ